MLHLSKRVFSGLCVVSLFLLYDFLRVWIVGNHFRQSGSEEGFLRIWLVHLLLAVVATLVFYLALALIPGKFKQNPDRQRFLGSVFLAGLVVLMCIMESQHHYKGSGLGVGAGVIGALVLLGLGFFTRIQLGFRHLLLVQVVILLLPTTLALTRSEGSRSRHPVSAPGLPNIFLLVVDTVRSDHLSCYGYPRITTPFLDGLALRSLRFDRAYSATPTTTPSTAAILGAPYPFTDDFPENRMVPAELGLAEYLAAAGYETGAVSANPFIAPTMGFDRGFQHFQNLRFPEKDYALTHVLWVLAEKLGLAMPDLFRGELVNVKVKNWLDSRTGEAPLFCYVHYMDPHYPYTPRSEFRSRFLSPDKKAWPRFPVGVDFGQIPFQPGTPITDEIRSSMIALYDAEIAQWDQALEQLWLFLEEGGWLDHALVVVTSDHGEAFFEHQTWIHGNSLYEEMLRVPFLVYRSWDREPGIVEEPVSNTGTFSLIRSLIERYPQNKNAFDPVASMTPKNKEIPFQYSYGFFRGAAITDGFTKRMVMLYRNRPLYQVFSLQDDPLEKGNLAPDSTDLDLSEWESVISLVPRALGSRGEMGKSTEELLKSLGYIQ